MMTLIAQTRTNIQCSSEKAFSMISNMERFGEWFPAVLSIQSENELAHCQVGKKYLETVAVPLRGTRLIELTVKESVANQRFVTEGKFPPLLPRMEIEIAEAGNNQITLQWSMFSRNTNRFVIFLLLPLAKTIMQKRANIGVARLKTVLESSAA